MSLLFLLFSLFFGLQASDDGSDPKPFYDSFSGARLGMNYGIACYPQGDTYFIAIKQNAAEQEQKFPRAHFMEGGSGSYPGSVRPPKYISNPDLFDKMIANPAWEKNVSGVSYSKEIPSTYYSDEFTVVEFKQRQLLRPGWQWSNVNTEIPEQFFYDKQESISKSLLQSIVRRNQVFEPSPTIQQSNIRNQNRCRCTIQ